MLKNCQRKFVALLFNYLRQHLRCIMSIEKILRVDHSLDVCVFPCVMQVSLVSIALKHVYLMIVPLAYLQRRVQFYGAQIHNKKNISQRARKISRCAARYSIARTES